MSRIFGPIYQIGYVVEDIDAAVDHWVKVLGIGPFFRSSVELELYRHRGRESKPQIEVALGYSGDLQIEIIQQANDAPSAYVEFLRDHGPGLQHLSVLSNDYDADLARHAALGCKAVTELKIKNLNRAIFYDFTAHAGAIMEVAENVPGYEKVREIVRKAATGWDGSDPVRTFSRKRSNTAASSSS